MTRNKQRKPRRASKEDEPKSEDKNVEVHPIDARPIDTDAEQISGKLAELAA